VEIERFYLGCLAHASYLVHDCGNAAVIDPQRDVQVYIDRARELGLQIRWVIETHLHADFVSGHVELGVRTGAEICLGADSGAKFQHKELSDGDELPLGSGKLRVLSTPGHTEESISILAIDATGTILAAFTGDTLFIGDVGRPDLSPNKTPRELAGLLYASLHSKLMMLPDDTLVYPAHGAGSLCGKQMSSDSSSTIGRERRENYALKAATREEFIELLTGDLPPRPTYFQDEVERNRSGAAALDQLTPVARLSPDEADALQKAGAVVLDTRSMMDFSAAHIPGSIHVALGGQFASWAARVLGIGQKVAIVAEDDSGVAEARLRLARVGLENVAGSLGGGVAAWIQSGRPVQPLTQISALDLEDLLRHAPAADIVIDVREPAERLAGFIPGSVSIPLPQLSQRLSEIKTEGTIIVHCKGGYRSSVAASMLQSAGFPNVVNLTGGYDAWKLSAGKSLPAGI
jgi:hydroxyacylglutathione hydrolase